MNYELAKQLKEAGFPQPEYTEDTKGDYYSEGDGKIIYVPTLSELIEACGGGFIYLAKDSNRWDAKSQTYIISKMSSPEEAVAKLWLNLKQTSKE